LPIRSTEFAESGGTTVDVATTVTSLSTVSVAIF
jgi:hypothetical protein